MITCFGTITKDIITSNRKTVERFGGAPVFFSNVCQKLDFPHLVVSSIGKEDIAKISGIPQEGLHLVEHTAELCIKEDEHDTSCRVVHSSIGVSPQHIPEAVFGSKIILISPFMQEYQPMQISGAGMIALDLQGFMRDPTSKSLSEHIKQKPKDLDTLLKFTDILKLNAKEASIICGNISIEKQLEMLSGMGPSIVLITQGNKGVSMIEHGNSMHADAPKSNANNTIGAGDTLFSAFLVHFYLNNHAGKSLKAAIAFTHAFLEERL
jgi:sugar/nucleoside kinase (ribokinase family)